ncbi:hypothetical protein NB311A_02591 [Nitrobacter sp. Nb-311A]|uniref:BrnA antitoxin family protein n=1 Tax=unclassified Nitrobacter TaxID=2620411 RepID=UPI0000687572|nr:MULTISPECIES: BrnA antitoxin family protein [unclassified Nitrobacter]EAQ34688.1 hypothetical protein NB311A_02591 [Nitrobacter sp. Nb-311A]MCV0385154.1 BrnA antitoxin family protein [Nitrobacter sp.]
MTSKWPQFITKDLGPDDDAEMMRRWQAYDRDMRAIIAKGGVHQDDDGWWVDDATGELIGPDPDIERPRSSDEIAMAKPFAEALPDLAESIKRARGRPKVENPKEAVTLRLSPATVERFKAAGNDWRARMAETLERAKIG